MPRKRHVSRNLILEKNTLLLHVMPRKRHVSRNCCRAVFGARKVVMPRKRHVSRNYGQIARHAMDGSHASQEACE